MPIGANQQYVQPRAQNWNFQGRTYQMAKYLISQQCQVVNLSTFPLNLRVFGNGSLSGSNWSYAKRFDIVGTYQYQSDSDPNQLHGIITIETTV